MTTPSRLSARVITGAEQTAVVRGSVLLPVLVAAPAERTEDDREPDPKVCLSRECDC